MYGKKWKKNEKWLRIEQSVQNKMVNNSKKALKFLKNWEKKGGIEKKWLKIYKNCITHILKNPTWDWEGENTKKASLYSGVPSQIPEEHK